MHLQDGKERSGRMEGLPSRDRVAKICTGSDSRAARVTPDPQENYASSDAGDVVRRKGRRKVSGIENWERYAGEARVSKRGAS